MCVREGERKREREWENEKTGMPFRSVLSIAIWNVLLFWLTPEGKLKTMSKWV